MLSSNKSMEQGEIKTSRALVFTENKGLKLTKCSLRTFMILRASRYFREDWVQEYWERKMDQTWGNSKQDLVIEKMKKVLEENIWTLSTDAL